MAATAAAFSCMSDGGSGAVGSNADAVPCPDSCVVDVMTFRALGPRGETLLHPIQAELLFILAWRNSTSTISSLVRLLAPSRYPHIAAVGELPVGAIRRGVEEPAGAKAGTGESGNDVGVVTGTGLVAAVVGAVYAAEKQVEGVVRGAAQAAQEWWQLSAEDSSLYKSLGNDVSCLVSTLFWMDDCIYDTYVWKTLLRSAPLGVGRYSAWVERRRRCSELTHHGAKLSDAVQKMEDLLRSLSARLGDSQTYGSCLDDRSKLSLLDARVYGLIAVLSAVPRECPGTVALRIRSALVKNKALVEHCRRVESQVHAWPSRSSFMASLLPDAHATADVQRRAQLNAESARLRPSLHDEKTWPATASTILLVGALATAAYLVSTSSKPLKA